jgi:hypothetical protein
MILCDKNCCYKFLKTTQVEHHVWSRQSRRQGRSHIALWLLPPKNDVAPCSSESATLQKRFFYLFTAMVIMLAADDL